MTTLIFWEIELEAIAYVGTGLEIILAVFALGSRQKAVYEISNDVQWLQEAEQEQEQLF